MPTFIADYGTHELVKKAKSTHRSWLHTKFDDWLAALCSLGVDEKTVQLRQKRMFMLLADAGMGKSVFCAIVNKKLTEDSTPIIKTVSNLIIFFLCLCLGWFPK